MSLIRNSIVTARKDYTCDASWLFNNYLGVADLDKEEDVADYRVAEADGFKIRKGQKYRYCVYTDGGDLRVYRGRLDMDNICQRHDCFDE